MIATILPSVNAEAKLERRCPHCGRLGGRIHSRVTARTISDTKVEEVFQQRLRCAFCGNTWILYSQGVGPGRQRSDRVIGLDLKIRTKTMRGFKNSDKNIAHPYLSEFLRGTDGLCDLRKVI